MSSYNSTLQSNNTELQSILDMINELPDAGGDPILQNKTITPTTSQQTITADNGYDGLDTVTVQGDNNLVAENIKSGTEIFGITGTYEGEGNTDSPYDTLFTYTVDEIDGATYGFAKNDNDYYESQNKGKHNSYAICRVNLVVNEMCDITFNVINYADSYDYAIFGNLDSSLKLSTSENSDIKKSFKNLNSTAIVEVVYNNVSVGSHYIDIKFIKSASGSSYNDSVQFKLVDIFKKKEDCLITRSLTDYTNSRITFIPDNTFLSYNKLTNVDFPNVKNIGSNAFQNCTNLTTINFPNAKNIEVNAFNNCGLTNVDFPNVTVIKASTFYSCKNLTTVNFPKVTSIMDHAFYTAGLVDLVDVNFPNLSTIGSSAFRYCYKLTNVDNINVTRLETQAFYGCTSLTTVNLPNVSHIGNETFYSCTKLTNINIPNLKYLSYCEFHGCTSLTTISFPNLRSIGTKAFHQCFNLEHIDLPKVSNIDTYAFGSCYNRLSSINFPNVQTIGSSAFRSCSSLVTASFPSVLSIYNSAFYSCKNLEALYLVGSNICKLFASNAFSNTKLSTTGSIYVPASLLTSYQTATNWAYFSNRMVGI